MSHLVCVSSGAISVAPSYIICFGDAGLKCTAAVPLEDKGLNCNDGNR